MPSNTPLTMKRIRTNAFKFMLKGVLAGNSNLISVETIGSSGTVPEVSSNMLISVVTKSVDILKMTCVVRCGLVAIIFTFDVLLMDSILLGFRIAEFDCLSTVTPLEVLVLSEV
eukprot:NODE_383_length_8356_cov_0.477898.p8 type:complete len:114 gc:universal NODE_383_length_8356_cov_0.477898:5449-5108(-)